MDVFAYTFHRVVLLGKSPEEEVNGRHLDQARSGSCLQSNPHTFDLHEHISLNQPLIVPWNVLFVDPLLDVESNVLKKVNRSFPCDLG